MSVPPPVWGLVLPTVAAGLAAILLRLLQSGRAGKLTRWTGSGVLLLAVLGLVAQAQILLLAGNSDMLGIAFVPSPILKIGVVAVDAGLVCMLLLLGRIPTEPEMVAAGLSGTLLCAGILAADVSVQALCLLGASICVVALPVFEARNAPEPDADSDPAKDREWAGGVAGGLKQLSLACISMLLMVAGGVLAARYPLHMENSGTLRAGWGLLCVGLAVRTGTLPFSGGPTDLLRGARAAGLLLMAALTPAALFVGIGALLSLVNEMASITATSRTIAMGLGAVGAFLAGLRAVGAVSGRGNPSGRYLLIVSSAGLQSGWALFGLLSGTRDGTVGAAMLALNMALAVPLLVSAQGGAAVWLGPASLLGLLPLGGFVGSLLVGKAAVAAGGWWLAILLAGTLLTASAWSKYARLEPSVEDGIEEPSAFAVPALVGAQVVVFAISVWLNNTLP